MEKDPRGDFHEAFRFILPGYNVRPLEISGAIGVEQLKRLDGLVAAAAQPPPRSPSALAGVPGVRLQREIGESSWFGFGLILEPKRRASRDEVVARLASRGVMSRPIVAGNFVKNPVIARLAHEPPPPLPNAEEIDARGFYIGAHRLDDGRPGSR